MNWAAEKNVKEKIQKGSIIGFIISLLIFIYRFVFPQYVILNDIIIAIILAIGILGIILKVFMFDYISKSNYINYHIDDKKLIILSTIFHYSIFEVLINSLIAPVLNNYAKNNGYNLFGFDIKFKTYLTVIKSPYFFILFLIVLILSFIIIFKQNKKTSKVAYQAPTQFNLVSVTEEDPVKEIKKKSKNKEIIYNTIEDNNRFKSSYSNADYDELVSRNMSSKEFNEYIDYMNKSKNKSKKEQDKNIDNNIDYEEILKGGPRRGPR